MAVTAGILLFALTGILNGLLPVSTAWTTPSLQSPFENFGSPTTPAVLPRPARPGAETNP
jgi:hypothetical protein